MLRNIIKIKGWAIFTIFLVLSFTGCGGGGGGDAPPLEFVSISGKINNLSGTGEPGVVIEGVYVSPDNQSNPSAATDTNGNFSLQVLKNEAVSLRATKDTFATINSAKAPLNADVTDVEIDMPTMDEAQSIINTAFGAGTTPLENKAWLIVNVVDASGNEVNGQSISSSIPLGGEVYTNCDGTDSGIVVTTGAPCTTEREGVMYIAYYDTAGEANITVGTETQVAPLRMGEVTVLEFEDVADNLVTVSGKVTDKAGVLLAGVDVEFVYTSAGAPTNPSTTTVVNGNYSVPILKNTAGFGRVTKSDFATMNTFITILDSDWEGLDIAMPTEIQMQGVINIALGTTMIHFADNAWLLVDVLDATEEEINGESILSSVTPSVEVYTNCNGTDSMLSVTTGAPCIPDRLGSMYIAYFNVPLLETNVTVGTETKTAPVFMGEVTYRGFVLGSFTAGKAKYDASCASCHKAGSYDTSGSDSDLFDDGEKVITDLNLISGMGSVLSLTSQQVLDLKAFLEDPSIM